MALPEIPHTAFSLPPEILEDPSAQDLINEYQVYVVRVQAEIRGLPLNTLAHMLVERSVTNYVILKWRERRGDAGGGFEDIKSAKDFNSFWLASVREVNSVMSRKSDDEIESAVAQRFARVIDAALEGLHPDVAAPLRHRLATAFEAAGL
jgi:hypothetical protein